MEDILKEAIADAKAVRETALANAKLVLEEAFTPHLKSMLSKKLQSEEEGMEAEDEEMTDEEYSDEDEEMASSDIGDAENEEPAAAASEADAQGPEEEGAPVEPGMEDEDAEEASDQPMGETEEPGMEDEDEEGMEAEDEDLAEVLRQLEQEMGMEDEDEEEIAEEGEPGMEDEEDEPVAEEEGMEDEDDDVDLDEIIKALSEEEGMEDEDEDEAAPAEEAMVPAAELEEYKQTVHYLKDKLSEVNLLNAKLLYTNKLFRSRNVSETQKMKVIEQFDRAANVREVKLVYTTFAESMTRTTVNESAKRKSQASKPVASTKSKRPIIGESVDFVSRMQKLANINK